MEMKDYLKYLPSTDMSIDQIIKEYSESFLCTDEYAKKVRYAIVGLYKKYQENGQDKKIETLKSFIDVYGKLDKNEGGLYWPLDINTFKRACFDRAVAIISSKFEKEYAREFADCKVASGHIMIENEVRLYDDNLDKNLRGL